MDILCPIWQLGKKLYCARLKSLKSWSRCSCSQLNIHELFRMVPKLPKSKVNTDNQASYRW